MKPTLDLQNVWNAVKRGGKVAERELAACEQLLETRPPGDLYLAILIVGVARRPDDRRIGIVESYLRNGRTDAERYAALRVLCRYWELWERYLPDLFAKTAPAAWENDYALADEATTLLGEYLQRQTEDNVAWGRLVEVYDHANSIGDTQQADAAYHALFVAIKGSHEKLRAQLSNDDAKDASVILAARDKA